MTDQIAGHEIATHENTGQENAKTRTTCYGFKAINIYVNYVQISPPSYNPTSARVNHLSNGDPTLPTSLLSTLGFHKDRHSDLNCFPCTLHRLRG